MSHTHFFCFFFVTLSCVQQRTRVN
jgi:hypothetical protein